MNRDHEALLSELTNQTEQAERFARLAGLTQGTVSTPLKDSHAGDTSLSAGVSGSGGEQSSLTAELERRYSLLLQLYGEKLEEVNELRLDLTEAKDVYKSQVVIVTLRWFSTWLFY